MLDNHGVRHFIFQINFSVLNLSYLINATDYENINVENKHLKD